MLSKKDRVLIVTLMVAGFIGSLSQNLLSSALPSIMAYFGVDAATGQWLTTVYILIFGVITAVSAYMFYRFSTKTIVLASLATFLAGCVLALLAPTFPVLLLARVVQAVGAGLLIPVFQVVVLYLYPPQKQGQALGLSGIIVGFAPAVGPTLSGLLVDAFGWRSIFVLLIGFTAVTLAICPFVLRDFGEKHRDPLDVLSVGLYAVGFTAFTLAVSGIKKGQLQSSTLLLFAFGLCCLFVFCRRQLGAEKPVLKLSLFRNSLLVLGTVLLGIAYVLMMAGTTLVPLFNQTLCGASATVSGLILLPGSLLIALLSPVSGRLMDRYGARLLTCGGMLCLLAGNGAFCFFNEQVSPLPVVLAYGMRSVGLAFLITACTTLGVRSLPLTDKPHGTAILNSLRQMSGALFSALLVTVATATSAPDALNLHGVHTAFAVMTAFAASGLMLAAAKVKQ